MSAKNKSPRELSEKDKIIAANLRLWRWISGYSISKFAKELNISSQQYQKYEYASNRISAGRLSEAANILKLPVSVFFLEETTEILQSIASSKCDSISEKERRELFVKIEKIYHDDINKISLLSFLGAL